MAQTFRYDYQLRFNVGQTGAFLDIPTRFNQPVQLASASAHAVNASTNAILDGVSIVIESNGFIVRPVESGRPEVDIAAGGTIRIVASCPQPSAVPVVVTVTLFFTTS